MKFTQTERNHYNDQVGKIRTITKYSKPINNLITFWSFMLLFAIRSYVSLGRRPLILPLSTSQTPEIDRCAPHRQPKC